MFTISYTLPLLYNIFEKASIIIYNVFGDFMFMIKNNLEQEFIIKKSKFICKIYKVKTEKEAKNILNELRKTYKDATHCCYAYIIGNVKRFNDDGEPNHTAGLPILNVLENKELNNVLAVVIRYFGGIKLGAGGLTRAYSNVVAKSIKDDNVTPIINTVKIKIEFNYNAIKNVDYILKDHQITYKEFGKNVIYEFICEENKYPNKLDKYIIKKT